MLRREEGLAAVLAKRRPNLVPVMTCLATQTIREVELLLIDSATQMLVLVHPTDGRRVGILTLHDLLRAEVAYGEG